jgi:hypothetical protein
MIRTALSILSLTIGSLLVPFEFMILSAQSGAQSRYPIPPTTLPEAEEIALALSAAPAEVSSRADVYVLRGSEYVKVRSGTNGCACMVSRDLHEASRYPMCFDQEAARSIMLGEMRAASLRARGLTEPEVKREVAAAIASGVIPRPSRPALAYMMSPQQVLFSTPDSSGRRIGAWHPHIMMAGVQTTPERLGLLADSRYPVIQSGTDDALHELVVLLPVWSDGSAAPTPRVR